MFKKEKKNKIHVNQFEQNDRIIDVKVEIDALPKTRQTSWLGIVAKVIFFPLVFPFKICWFFLKNIINE